jgi:hypothetical protein
LEPRRRLCSLAGVRVKVLIPLKQRVAMTSTAETIRYPLAPLASAVGVNASNRDIATACGVAVRTVIRWKRDGLSTSAACKAADAIREHQFLLWPDMADRALKAAEAAERALHERTKEIQRKAWRKKWAAMTEEQKEAKRNYVREYRTQARGAIRAHRRRYYAENRDRELERQREYDARKRADRRAG